MGKAYQMNDFRESNTFRTCNQENLLVADNRTDEYLMADSDGKKCLAAINWGENAMR